MRLYYAPKGRPNWRWAGKASRGASLLRAAGSPAVVAVLHRQLLFTCADVVRGGRLELRSERWLLEGVGGEAGAARLLLACAAE